MTLPQQAILTTESSSIAGLASHHGFRITNEGLPPVLLDLSVVSWYLLGYWTHFKTADARESAGPSGLRT